MAAPHILQNFHSRKVSIRPSVSAELNPMCLSEGNVGVGILILSEVGEKKSMEETLILINAHPILFMQYSSTVVFFFYLPRRFLEYGITNFSSQSRRKTVKVARFSSTRHVMKSTI